MMAVQLGLLFLVYAAASAQAVLAPRMAIGAAVPEFLLMVGLAAVLAVRGWPALLWAALAGVAGDCLSDRPIGVGMLTAVLVGLFVQRSLDARSRASVIRTTCVSAGALGVMILSRDALSAALTGDRIGPAMLLSTASVAAVYSTLIAAAICGCWPPLRGVCRPLFARAV